MRDKDYSDIIHLVHHTSKNRIPMPLSKRAAQFAPFAALRSYDETLKEVSRVTDSFITLSDNKIEEISFKLQILEERINEQNEVTIIYFQKDEKKAGGTYLTIIGKIKKFDYYNQTIVFMDQSTIYFDNIIDIQSGIFSSYEF